MEISEAVEKNLPFETVKQWATSDRGFVQEHLRPALKFRPGQPLDRYRFAVKQMVGAWPRALQGMPGSAPKYADLPADSKQIEASKNLQNQVLNVFQFRWQFVAGYREHFGHRR